MEIYTATNYISEEGQNADSLHLESFGMMQTSVALLALASLAVLYVNTLDNRTVIICALSIAI